jgi:hypothetical protein
MKTIGQAWNGNRLREFEVTAKRRATVCGLAVIFMLSLAMALPSSAFAGTSKCTAKKYLSAGKALKGIAQCWSKAVKKGETSPTDCRQIQLLKLQDSWPKAEKKEDCVTTNVDDSDLSDALFLASGFLKEDTLCLSYSWSCSGFTPSKCDAAKLKAIGQGAFAFAKGYAKATKKGDSLGDNLAQSAAPFWVSNVAKTQQKLIKAEAKGDCSENFDNVSPEYYYGSAFQDYLGTPVNVCCRRDSGTSCVNIPEYGSGVFDLDDECDAVPGTLIPGTVCQSGGDCVLPEDVTTECTPFAICF